MERLRHLLYAGAISFVLLLTLMFQPIDWVNWAIQSNISHHKPSGDIVFVGTDRDVVDPRMGHRRRDLAAALHELDRQGVGKVYIDLVFDQPSDEAADRQLEAAIASLGPRAVIVDQIEQSATSDEHVSRSVNAIAGQAQRVVSRRWANWMGFTWSREYGHMIDGLRYPSFAASLGGVDDARAGEFQIDYGIRSEDIAALQLHDITKSANPKLTNLAGKTIVIGEGASLADARQKIPGNHSVPYSYVAIYGAESLKAGRTSYITAFNAYAIFVLGFASMLVVFPTRKRRHLGYIAFACSIPLALYAGSLLGIRMELSYCAAFLLIYCFFRSRARWKNHLSMVDTETGLPKLRALEAQLTRSDSPRGHVVVARIHGYEHVLKTLAREYRAQYVLRLVDRVRAADSDLAIYFEGHNLAWHTKEDNVEALVEHLEGLRAIFAAPISVSGSSVDVGISFGVARIDGDAGARLAAAIAAAEESSEALQPIKIAESNSHFDELWDISLRARIDDAMEAGEIYCVYQPKIDTKSNMMTGVEALVRWHDPARGFIPPMHFIAQCEKAGRMEHLTRYVLQSACTAAKLIHFRGNPIAMSVNISATLLGDMRIVGLVRNVLQATDFDARSLVLEVTETSRIGDLATAATILKELKALGTRISIDDFGVGAANFETFFELPFDELKIDRLFVSNLTKSAKARAIAASIVAMGNQARIAVVAEGAEDDETLKILNEIGCSQVQGYALARPLSLANLLEFNTLEDHVAREA